jgi:hypothetical protein
MSESQTNWATWVFVAIIAAGVLHHRDQTKEQRSEAAEERAAEAAESELASTTFEEARGASDCTEDCSGHEAGFEWARDHAVTDISECGGNSESFQRGCEAYAEELEERRAEAVEDDEREEAE